MSAPVRVSIYIDGFNVYHRIAEHYSKTGKSYRWLDYRKALEKLLGDSEKLGDVWFFTSAPGGGKPAKLARHDTYIAALQKSGVQIKSGIFRNGKEKQTDVNLSVRMMEDAIADRYDRCYLVSGDSDFVEALRAVQRPPLEKEAGLIIPPHDSSDRERQKIVSALRDAASKDARGKPLVLAWQFRDLDGCSFPEKIRSGKGGEISMPQVAPPYTTF